jgi:D-alanyl-lipoteichoic acid acyltransferase DltB (MBOAT superfamily)
MLFPTVTFAIFFMIVLPVSWLLMPRRQRWKLFMLGASYFFYGYWNWRFVFLIVASTVINQVFAHRIGVTRSERARRWLLGSAVVFNLGLLGYFKYYDFFLTSAQNTLNSFGLDIAPEIVGITLPVGISFFTFQALSYVIDVYRRTFQAGKLLDFAVYLSFFPHVVAGPIVRAVEFMPQLKERHDPRKVDASRAFFLIFMGLFKKVVIANFLATEIVDTVFASPNQHSSLELLVGVYAYAIQIYADFSGYTDMAIGLALLLGFRFPQNFDRPYTATSIQDFWRRWHMTLSRWLRDYLYIPLGGNRGSPRTTYRNLMLTMVLGGLWHGAAWTFVIWGAIHGTVMCVEHFRRSRQGIRWNADQEPPSRVVTLRKVWIGRFVTFQIVCLAWIFFRAESLDNAIDVLTRIVDPSHWTDAAPLVTGGVLLAIGVGLLEQYIPPGVVGRAVARFSMLPPIAQGLVLGLALLVINTLGPRGVAPFIYFRF